MKTTSRPKRELSSGSSDTKAGGPRASGGRKERCSSCRLILRVGRRLERSKSLTSRTRKQLTKGPKNLKQSTVAGHTPATGVGTLRITMETASLSSRGIPS